jgi:predicted GNAT family acetyltransferase
MDIFVAGDFVQSDPDQLVSPYDLTNPVWKSLSGEHATLAQANRHALRYQPSVAPFGALELQSRTCVESLAQLVDSGEEVCLVDQEANVADLFEAVSHSEAVQMIYAATAVPSVSPSGEIRRLERADAPNMEALIAAVFPGYFRKRTHEMGEYYGIFIDGELAAMAGERLALPGLREISSICTASAHQGKGFAAQLTNFLVANILRTNRRPFLHVGSHNAKARRLYGKLGFNEIRVAAINLYRRV